jgi:hypothetical protein
MARKIVIVGGAKKEVRLEGFGPTWIREKHYFQSVGIVRRAARGIKKHREYLFHARTEFSS